MRRPGSRGWLGRKVRDAPHPMTRRQVASIARRAVDQEHADWEIIWSNTCANLVTTLNGAPSEIQCSTDHIVLYGQSAGVQKSKFLRTVGDIWIRQDAEMAVKDMYPMFLRWAVYKWAKPSTATVLPEFDLMNTTDWSEGPWIAQGQALQWLEQWVRFSSTRVIEFNDLAADPCTQPIAGLANAWEDCEEPAYCKEPRPIHISGYRLIPRGLTVKEDELLFFMCSWMYMKPGISAPNLSLYGGLKSKIAR